MLGLLLDHKELLELCEQLGHKEYNESHELLELLVYELLVS